MLPHVAPQHTQPGPDPDVAPFMVGIDLLAARVALVGEFDRIQAHHLPEVVAALVAAGHRSISVSTEMVTFCDTGGLRALLAGREVAARHGCELTFAETSRCVQRLISHAGLDAVLGTSGTATSASGTSPRVNSLLRSPR